MHASASGICTKKKKDYPQGGYREYREPGWVQLGL
jgi:hypothetical protein